MTEPPLPGHRPDTQYPGIPSWRDSGFRNRADHGPRRAQPISHTVTLNAAAANVRYLTPHPGTSALLTIDVQRDFSLPGAPAEVAGTMDAVPEMRRLVRAYRKQGRPVFHIVRLYLPDGSNADLCRRSLVEDGARIVLPGSDGAELVAELLPPGAPPLDARTLLAGDSQLLSSNEWTLYKPRWGAFYGTRLEGILRSIGIDTVVVCGCNFPNCPRATIYEASERDFRIVVASDAISGLYPRGQEELSDIGVTVLSTDECLAWIAKASEASLNAPGGSTQGTAPGDRG